MLVKDQEDSKQLTPGLEYLDEANSKLPEFLQKTEEELPRRVNKDELVKLFDEGGFFRSYSLRLTVSGRKFEKKRVIKTAKVKSIPTPKPPKRRENQGSAEQYSEDLMESRSP